MRYLFNISFDGRDYYGTQVQKDKRSVCGEVNRVLSKILNEEVKVVPTSRLDRGVHANNFYFHIDTNKNIDINKIKISMNKIISKDIYVKEIREVSDKFHARYSVKSKEYVYIINTREYTPYMRNLRLEYNKKIDIELLKKASKYLIGKKDFESFTSSDSRNDYVREIKYIKFEEKDGVLKIYVRANGFLRYMVRYIVGVLLLVNEGKIKYNEVEDILNKKSKGSVSLKVIPNGLYLNKVEFF